MEIVHIIALNSFCIILAVIAIWKIPISGIFGVLISLTVLLYEVINGNITDIAVRMYSILTVVLCAVGAIAGFNRN